jgi:hypothetical protein
MSGGGSAPKAPDLSGQTSQANQTFGTATSDAAQTNATAQAYNANSQATVNNITGQETPMVGAVNNTTNQNLSTYGSTFVPLQQQQAQAAQAWGSDANIQAQQGKAEADANSAGQASLANQRAALASEGVDPASVHGDALTSQAAVQNAATVAGAGTQAAQNTTLQSQQLVNQANQLGTQINAAGNQGAATASQIGNSTAATQSSVNAQDVNNTTAANSYLNTGINANNSALSAQQDQFQDQNTAFQDQQQAASGAMSAIGGLVGSAAKAYTGGLQEGGPVPHSSGIPPRFMSAKGAAGVMREFYERGGPVSNHGALPTSPIPGSTDTKPALLTPDEFVIPRDAATWKGHEHWYKQIDKAREDKAARMGLPPRPTSALTARGV